MKFYVFSLLSYTVAFIKYIEMPLLVKVVFNYKINKSF